MSLSSKFQRSNLICQSVNLTDDLKIGLQYDIQQGLLNIFVNNFDTNTIQSSQINIQSNSSKIQQQNEISNVTYWQNDDDDDEPRICIELSNIYVYDIDEEEEEEDREHDVDDYRTENNYCETMITSSPFRYSSSISSSCFDEQTTDNDDGYSTHSLDDTEQQQHSLSILPSKCLMPFASYQYDGNDASKETLSSIRRLVEVLIWLSPYRKSIRQMMMNNFFFN